jgi:Asp-tRNA(Asn)/Glu-tRNA(Gln) amidotransferase A subunit family amidase
MLHSHKLDHLGVYARTLEDIALIMDVIAGYDPDDPDSRPVAAPAFVRTVGEPPPATPNFAFVRTPMWDKAEPETREAFEELTAALGERVRPFDLPELFAGAWDAHRIIMMVDMAHQHAGLIARGGEANSEPFRRQVAQGGEVPAVKYLAALADARSYAESLADIFLYYDAIITPASPGSAPVGLESTGDPVFNALWTLTGLPALSLPLLQGENGMPLGVQLVGGFGQDARLLRTGRWLFEELAEKG